jgi:hypothetical protein
MKVEIKCDYDFKDWEFGGSFDALAPQFRKILAEQVAALFENVTIDWLTPGHKRDDPLVLEGWVIDDGRIEFHVDIADLARDLQKHYSEGGCYAWEVEAIGSALVDLGHQLLRFIKDHPPDADGTVAVMVPRK